MGRAFRNWSFLVPVALFTLFCSAAVWLVFWNTGDRMGRGIWGVISYHMLITVILHAWQERAFEHDPSGFVRRYLAGLAIKMFVSFLVLVVLILTLPEHRVLPVSLTFILLYLAYLGFSTARMTSVLARQKKR